jgi:hypothetical protein
MNSAFKKYIQTFLSLVILLAIPAWTTAQSVQPIFPSTAGHWQVRKTNGKIVAENSATGKVQTVFSEVDKPTEASRYDLASLVGPLLSMKESLYWEGGAHPGHLTRMETVNLDTDKSPVLLTDLFPETALLAALLKDRIIQKSLAGQKTKTIRELIQVADGGCEIGFHLLNESFAFHHIQKDRVAVRIGLSHGCKVIRGNYTELGFYLPIPQGLRDFLEVAAKRGTLQLKNSTKGIDSGV